MNLEKFRQTTQIIIEGKFRRQDIICSYTQTNILFNNEERLCIEEGWSQALKDKPFLFNGKLFHVYKPKFGNSKIILHMCNSSFKEFVGTNSKMFGRSFDKNKIVRPISVGTMIVTSDEKWVIGRRLKTYDYERSYMLVAGYMDPDKDILNSQPDPFFALKRELTEETGIHSDDTDDILCLGLAGENQPYLAFITSLNISLDQFNCMSPKEKEFVKFESYELKKEIIENFLLNNYKKISPHALANILLFYSFTYKS